MKNLNSWSSNEKVMHTGIQVSLQAVLVVMSLVLTVAAASADTIQSVDDTYITRYGAPLGDANSTQGDATLLYSIFSPFPNEWDSFPMVRFDLSAYTGQTVQGPATISMYVQGTDFGVQYLRQVSLHPALIPWSGATVSYNNFGPSPGVEFGTDVGDALDTVVIDYPGTGDRYVSWTLPAAVVQGWIDSPSSNNGLLIYNQSAGDLVFGSRETTLAPLLTLTVPEPATTTLILIGILSALCRHRVRFS